MLAVTATDLPRLMACNGSRLMGGSTPPVESDTTVRDEGIAAHWLVEQVHGGQFTAEELIDRKAENGVYITAEMVEYLEEYLSDITAQSEIEVDTSFHDWKWKINGRADLIEYDFDDEHLWVSDLKYGWSIVEPENNWTLIAHAIGWMIKNPDKPVESISFTIFQPRAYHPAGRIRIWAISRSILDELRTQLKNTLDNLNDDLNTSPHCYRCRAIATCPAARKAQMNAVDASERAFNDELDDDELSFQLDHMKRAVEVLKQQQKAYQDEALHRIRKGQIVNNYGLANEMTNRQWHDYVTPAMIQTLTGKDVAKPAALITPKQAEKAGVSEDVVASFSGRHKKGVKLVRVDANTKAKQLFNQPKGD